MKLSAEIYKLCKHNLQFNVMISYKKQMKVGVTGEESLNKKIEKKRQKKKRKEERETGSQEKQNNTQRKAET